MVPILAIKCVRLDLSMAKERVTDGDQTYVAG